MFPLVSVVPCQGCGSMILYQMRQTDHLTVCSSCNVGVLKIAKSPKTFKNKDGDLISYDYHNHNVNCRKIPPRPYFYAREYFDMNKTFIDEEIYYKCMTAKNKSNTWKLFDRMFNTPNRSFKYGLLSKICSLRMNGILTLEAYKFLMGFSNKNIYQIGIAEDTERIRHYSEIMELPRKVPIFGEEIIDYIDIYRYAPCVILCKSEDNVERLYQTILREHFYQGENIHLHYNVFLDKGKKMLRIGKTSDIAIHFLGALKRNGYPLPNDITEYIVNLFKRLPPNQN